jgi:hypothetical protein
MIERNLKKNRGIAALIIGAAFMFFSGTALASEINREKVIELVNVARVTQGDFPLAENAKLDRVAEDKLNDMITKGYFAHTSPKGVTPWFWYSKNNYDYKYAGENLAINFLSAEDEQKAWMESPLHRKNILNSNYREIGVAVGAGEINGRMSIIAVQEFGTLAGAVENGEKNFAPFEHKYSTDNNKPVVLSVEGGQKSGFFTDRFQKIKNSYAEVAAAGIWNRLAVLIFMMSLVSIPLAFVWNIAHRWNIYCRKAKRLKLHWKH